MDRQQLFKLLGTTRGLTLQTLSDLTPAQWTTIPEGFSNNILWNAAHIAATQARLLYVLNGLPAPIADRIIQNGIRGTSPKEWTEPLTPEDVLDVLGRLVPQTIEDDAAGTFNEFKPLELRPGLTLDSFDDAIVFSIMHEGMHIGMIMQLKKLVK